MESILRILEQPDDVAVLLLFVAAAAVSLVALREARRNDRLGGADARDEIAERMDR
ncbi:MAG TPA: hypothetical protein VF841_15765 [Anaeromyxobacter sp.]